MQHLFELRSALQFVETPPVCCSSISTHNDLPMAGGTIGRWIQPELFLNPCSDDFRGFFWNPVKLSDPVERP